MLSVTAASLSDTRTSGGYSTSFPAASGQDTRIRPSGGRAPGDSPVVPRGVGQQVEVVYPASMGNVTRLESGQLSAAAMWKRCVVVMLSVAIAASAAAQTPAEIEAEPILKLRSGETRVDGQCLTREELDLIAGLNALRRPTVGVEGDGDDPAPFDPHYFVGAWEVEGVLPESPLGESAEFLGTETVRHVGGCTYESTIDATALDSPVTVSVLMEYDRRARYLVRLEDDSRGYRLLKVGVVGGDPGGYFSHHWRAAPVTSQGRQVLLDGRTFITSPDNYETRMRIAVDGEASTNFGRLRWRRIIDGAP